MTQLNRKKQQFATRKNQSSETFPTEGLASYSVYNTQSLVKFLNVTFVRSKFNAQTMLKLTKTSPMNEAILYYLLNPHFLYYPP